VTAPTKVGLVVPSFRLDAATGIDTAVRAEAAGLDGAFVYDHLFPMGQPERPAVPCFPMLGAMAVATDRLVIGPLVARVGVVPNAVLVNMFDTLGRMAPGRVIAGVGTGDSKSQKENELFGLPFGTVAERVAATAEVCRQARRLGLPVWVGGQSPSVRRLAAEEADAINVWAMTPEEVATVTDVEVTWAGPPPDGDLGGHIAALAEAGATWVIYGAPPSHDWPAFVDRLAAASARL
jgi:alkanesulfonate monooxygenase SsuD/methylene tetrahydromethanopterin reductase-like flavin-dependent oxidoreductase (luciferase family)